MKYFTLIACDSAEDAEKIVAKAGRYVSVMVEDKDLETFIESGNGNNLFRAITKKP